MHDEALGVVGMVTGDRVGSMSAGCCPSQSELAALYRNRSCERQPALAMTCNRRALAPRSDTIQQGYSGPHISEKLPKSGLSYGGGGNFPKSLLVPPTGIEPVLPP